MWYSGFIWFLLPWAFGCSADETSAAHPATSAAATRAGQKMQIQRLNCVARSPRCSPPIRSSVDAPDKRSQRQQEPGESRPGPARGSACARPPDPASLPAKSELRAACCWATARSRAGLLSGKRRQQIGGLRAASGLRSPPKPTARRLSHSLREGAARLRSELAA